MKKLMLITIAMIILFATTLSAKPEMGISFNFFYSSLQPYGSWIQIDNDVVAWRPHNTYSDWRPYSVGRWSWTDNGWYWDSDEPFGWATYHYGRWYLDDNYGWMWIPDYEWAPSWVEWRYNDDYIGWAPLPPYASFNIHLGIHFSIRWNAGYNWWNFVSYNRFCDSHIHHHLLDYRRSHRIFESTKYRNNFYYDHDRIINGGIDRSFVERRGGYRISEREIRSIDNRNDFERSRGRDGNRVYAYRPSENEISRNGRDNKFEIQRGDRSSTIERDKLSTPRFNDRSDANDDRNRNDERNISRNEQRDTDKSLRAERNNERQNADREREAIRSREESQRRENERREAIRSRENERQQMENRAQSERRVEQERRIERRQEQSSERPSFRTEGNNSRSESRSEGRSERESRGSERRR